MMLLNHWNGVTFYGFWFSSVGWGKKLPSELPMLIPLSLVVDQPEMEIDLRANWICLRSFGAPTLLALPGPGDPGHPSPRVMGAPTIHTFLYKSKPALT